MPIPNHYTAALSDLDLRMVRSVPPGGNWKDIPSSIPSRRLEQIRTGFAAGLGSRSTYYGRLSRTEPAYTITTYFNRPGNGCHVHPDFEGGQHRLISQREAARLQSFPDSFVFYGSRGSIYKQIGNAVPPLLAYQLATTFGPAGSFVDLFCGAGGLSLGFVWAGWTPVVGADFDASSLRTYRANVHEKALEVNLAADGGREKLVVEANKAPITKRPLLVLGGPPCQGFSTAGNRRSMSDLRNQLFHEYAAILRSISPDGFVFENVPGLLSMEGGTVFQMVRDTLSSAGYNIVVWDLHAHHFAVPQRRRRLFLVGTRDNSWTILPPMLATPPHASLFGDRGHGFITVQDAIGDLPPLIQGEDGSTKEYLGPPVTHFQRFMRGEITAVTMLAQIAVIDQ